MSILLRDAMQQVVMSLLFMRDAMQQVVMSIFRGDMQQ
jgi:hypothetical protein